MSVTNDRLAELGIELPTAPAPAGNYLSCMQVGSLLYISGAICLVNGEMTHTGKIGETRNIAYGQEAARVCALNEPPPIPSNAANLTPWTKSNFLAVSRRSSSLSGNTTPAGNS